MYSRIPSKSGEEIGFASSDNIQFIRLLQEDIIVVLLDDTCL